MKYTCPNCSYEIDRDMNNCPNCGKGIESPSSKRFNKFIAIFIVFMLLLLSVMVYYIVLRVEEYYKPKGIEIDGDFDDWREVPMMADEIESQPFNQNVDIVDFRVEGLYEELSFYVEVQGSIFEGERSSDGHVDTVYIFIDSDQDPQTGYLIENLGCEYMLVICGQGSQVLESRFYIYPSTRQNWNAWEERKEVSCSIEESRLETQIRYRDVGLGNDGAVDVLFYLQSWDGFEDISDTIISNEDGVLIVEQTGVGEDVISGYDNSILRLEFLAKNADATVISIILTQRGIVGHDDILAIKLVNNLGNMISQGTLIPNKVIFSLNIQLNEDQNSFFFVLVDIAHNAKEENSIGLIVMDCNDITSDVASVSLKQIKSSSGNNEVSYIHRVPEYVKLDSAFADWDDKQVRNDSYNNVDHEDLDIIRYGISCSEQSVSFYLKVKGQMCKGTTIPFWNDYSLSDGEFTIMPNENLTGLTGEDIIYIFISVCEGTGYNKSLPFGADFLIEITGQSNIIQKATLSHFCGENCSEWKWREQGQIDAAINYDELEASVTYSDININPETDRFEVFFSICDWDNEFHDYSDLEGTLVGPVR